MGIVYLSRCTEVNWLTVGSIAPDALIRFLQALQLCGGGAGTQPLTTMGVGTVALLASVHSCNLRIGSVMRISA